MPDNLFNPKSFWMTTRDYTPGPCLTEDIDVDVAIVGGGFTGLSTAFHLKKEQPDMRIAIFESEIIGFGASGRNGGFNMTLFCASGKPRPKNPIFTWNAPWTC